MKKPKQQSMKSAKTRQHDALAAHRHFLQQAERVANGPVSGGGSPHPSVKVGALLVSGMGKVIAADSNRFPQDVDRRRPERYRNGYKSLWINCAEQMVLMQALKKRAAVAGSTLYVTLEPCAVCAGMVAELKLQRVCVPVGALRRYAKLKSKWKESIEVGMIKLAEARIDLLSVDMGTSAGVKPRRRK